MAFLKLNVLSAYVEVLRKQHGRLYRGCVSGRVGRCPDVIYMTKGID